MLLQDREHHLALAHRGRILDLPFLGHRQKIGRGLGLEIGEIQTFGHEDTFGRVLPRRQPQDRSEMGSAWAGRPRSAEVRLMAAKVNGRDETRLDHTYSKRKNL